MHLLSFLSNDSQYLQFTFRTSHFCFTERARGMSSRARVQMMRQALAEEQVLKAKYAAATIIENVARQTVSPP